MNKVIVTGGCGYIGAHTIVDLISEGYDVISIDNNSRSDENILNGVQNITGKKIKNYKVDLCDLRPLKEVFEVNPGITTIIHFAAFKAVPESVAEPLLYYHNNLVSVINILKCAAEYKAANFVFSSSCSVYGNTTDLPVVEDSPLKEAESPYGRTKQIGEKIISDFALASKANFVLLRYFNPVGAHESADIGEVPYGIPENLVPILTMTGAGKIKTFTVHGNDYPTRDGTCVRDYVHVMDIAKAHTLAMQYLQDNRQKSNCEIFNLGSGKGTTVLEAIGAFEEATGVKLNYKTGPRRPGDVAAIYADNKNARKKLNWSPQRSMIDVMSSAWKWQSKLNEKNISYRT